MKIIIRKLTLLSISNVMVVKGLAGIQKKVVLIYSTFLRFHLLFTEATTTLMIDHPQNKFKYKNIKTTAFASLLQSVESSSTPSTPLTPDTPLLPPPEPYNIRTIGKEDTEKVLAFLRTFFFRDEPLNVDIKLLEDEQTCPDLEEFSLKAIKDNVSLMAITDSGKIIGVSLNGLIERNIAADDDDLDVTDPKFSKILGLLNYVDKEANVFERYPDVNKMILVEILSVDGSWRGQGIAKKLMNKTR